MKFFRVLFFFFACLMAMASNVSAAPKPDFGKELEKIGQHVRDAIISARPAVDVIRDAQKIYNNKYDDDDDDK
ncbi:hyphancin-3G-like [Leguminivora glycinivorella]|uniref:hyphancin-3G-like n=1 Tax=Leguminivora glycinivorella TaxID=1035111 RepID=UPI00200FE9D3|nr:hyphancin-3G-like [Leguminivora glycinivorella]XP_048001624.1 hyphancin-3G-like [Leguminivora glycinivorella]XP_048001625.1 hyphancin-3G-like [Leguminivora glycinivorella]